MSPPFNTPGRGLRLTGKKFGSLTVLREAAKISRGSKWVCGCFCGIERIVDAGRLRDGRVQSCRGVKRCPAQLEWGLAMAVSRVSEGADCTMNCDAGKA